MVHNSEASENWDDDFEFHSNKTARRSHSDHDFAQDQDLRDKTHDPQPRHRDSHETTTENWDDDFAEDEDHDHDSADPNPHSNPNSIHPDSEPEHDDAHPTLGFSLPPPPQPSARTPRASKIAAQRMRAGSASTARQGHGAEWGDSNSSDDDELGFGADEDRTVTARNRRTLAYNLNASPPPPVPPLPSGSLGRGFGRSIGLPNPMDMGGHGLQPFPPRSPTASVFSAPDSASIAYTHTSAGSTTALTRPRNTHAASARGLAGLPPSPPIHRERRRLRKKSRPNPGAAHVEMREVPRGVGSSDETGTGEEEDWDAEEDAAAGSGATAVYGPGYGAAAGGSTSSGPVYPKPTFAPTAHPNSSNANSSFTNSHHSTPYGNQPPGASASGSHVVLGSPGLLARIGSVKRWGSGFGGRKKSSSVSVGSVGMGDDLDVIQDITAHANGLHNEATPRPPSANSLLRTGSHSSSRSRHSYPAHAAPPPTTPPPKNKKRHSQYGNGSSQKEGYPKTPPQTPPEGASSGRPWFFRGVSGSPADRERDRERERERGRFRGGGGGGVGRDGAAGDAGDVMAPERPYTPTPHGEKEGKTKLVKRRSLGFVQIRRAIRPLNGHGEGEEDATPTANANAKAHLNQTPNASPSKGYGVLGVGRPSPAAVGSVEDLGRHKEREGMGFVERNVRRISLVGASRHKRTKSGVSITALHISGDEKENDSKGKKGAGAGTSANANANSTTGVKRSIEGLPPSPTPPVDVQLHPPSPPQTVRSSGSAITMKASAPINISTARKLDAIPTAFSPTFSLASSAGLASPISLASSSSPSLTPYSSPPHSHSNSPSSKPPVSPQSASLGRSAVINPVVSAAVANASPLSSAAGTMRRNSLGDLKIPARISQAQVGLRRDLSMVREFARNVEELKELQGTYQALVLEVQGILDMHVLHPSQLKEKEEKEPARVSPTFFKRHRSNTSSSNNGPPPTAQQQAQQAYKQLASAFYTINSKYRISWECAELLIELGGGGSASPPSTSTSAPAMQSAGASDVIRSVKTKRERAITLQDEAHVPPSPGPLQTTHSVGAVPSGPPMASPPSNLGWRASTGRNDLSQRQLLLLKEMLHSVPGGPDESFAEDIPEEVVAAVGITGSTNTVNREWRWGDAMNSTVTLPSEESTGQDGKPKEKKRRSSRMRMSGIRDMLRSLTKGGTPPPVPVSTASGSTESSADLHQQHLYQHRQRPSLASIFRIGKNNKTPPPSAAADVSLESAQDDPAELYPTFSGISGGRESASNSTGDEEEDWDRMEDSASDVEAAVAAARRGGSTIRGRSPYLHSSLLTSGRPTTPLRSPSGSRTSIHLDASSGAPARATRLSNVEEHADSQGTSKADSPSRLFSRSRRGGKTGSVRSMPPATLPDPKLAMTPENIKPLLENAREVYARLNDCIAEIRALLAASGAAVEKTEK
ncbi:hypothetical protein DFH06DRAFT_727810 [Mycena polygramma]|nr:hypothetical protein DFH06DRAFT_727810 [Mycena polygramma]